MKVELVEILRTLKKAGYSPKESNDILKGALDAELQRRMMLLEREHTRQILRAFDSLD